MGRVLLNGRKRDVHGNRIGTEYQEGHFKGVPLDPDDPPQYESEAMYLQTYGLLTPGEINIVKICPEALDPVAITVFERE